jgi:hypothetical protein
MLSPARFCTTKTQRGHGPVLFSGHGATNLSRTCDKQATGRKLLRIRKDYTSMTDYDVT